MGRTDNDTWDIASSVGATATMVAAGRARANRAALIDDPFAEPLVRAVGIDFFIRWASGELDSADVDIADAPWGMQRMTDQQAARTRFIDAFFAQCQQGARQDGIRQVVLLAAGLDARGYRLPWAAGTTVFEIDVPKVVEFKTATLAGLGAAPMADVRGVPVDLRHDWPAALRQAGFDTGRPTAWAAEGLFGYLPPQAQDRLLDSITELSADGSQLIAEVFFSAPASRELFDAIYQRWYDHGLDISIQELGFPGARNDVATYLADRGWRVQRTPINKLLVDNGFRPHAAVGASAEEALFAENYFCTAGTGKADPHAERQRRQAT
ncbi:class I SAM-dependent methyltransferase [Mycobacterium angelicum]|uniref:S-adenosyl-L-methionine-dependent methyltransferase n=1 Tax=Mycobacterium angelicum TaxID=470074 RepID=A0A1X0A915_MYCAN|nr:class I SAM-dependent methyltransferase [Mycobacterium angelicum]MCV7197644.1 class I SAM-dependent methyltransferase [Mycobacterium angelicum]ORA26514.1 SAM-dependent methyltransferase [Mycobacterium angelicum]